jgi:diguanylate cyclase (GGDEF)-like protein
MSQWKRIDWSARGWARVCFFTALGTVFCIAAAFILDSYSISTGEWRWGEKPVNNLIIPLLLAPPFFYYLLSKLRELSIAHHELMTVASTDGLTACLNRRAFTAMVEGYLTKVIQEQASAQGTLLVLDVDNFKVVNDIYGHDRGDEALKVIASAIKGSIRDVDLVGRLGGEEFSVFLPGLDHEKSRIVADRLRTAVNEARFVPGVQQHQLSVSVGGVSFARRAKFGDLYRYADERLYAAKRAGRNRVDIVELPDAVAA